MHTPESRKKT